MTSKQSILSRPSIEALVSELDVLIRARYPLIAVNTFEELRFRRVMQAVAQLERHVAKGLFLWTRTQGLRQIGGPDQGTLSEFGAVSGLNDPMKRRG